MVDGGIMIKAIRLMMALVGFAMLVGCGMALDYGYPAEDPAPDGADYMYEGSAMGTGHHPPHGEWYHTYYYDWLSPGATYYWGYPYTYYSSWYYTPTYTYTYYPKYYYTWPVYYSPVVYYDWNVDPWWATNVYGIGGMTYYYGTSWSYKGGFGFIDP